MSDDRHPLETYAGARRAGLVRVPGRMWDGVVPGTVVPGCDGVHVAWANRHGAVSVATATGLFGLRPGEFEWVEQEEWLAALGVWASDINVPARIGAHAAPA